MTINNDLLEAGVTYTIALEVTTNAGTGRDEFEFELNAPPELGSFTIEPEEGDAVTEFALICDSWFDPNNLDEVLTYTYSYTLDG